MTRMNTPCILFTGYLDPDGYGRIGSQKATRRLWMDVRGPIPPGLELDHLCRVRACVNLDHLEPVTHAENVRRAKAHQVLVTTCRSGHVGEYVMGSNGKRHCTGCKRERSRRDRPSKALGDPCGKGHEYDRQTAKGVRCSTCMSAQGKANMAKRWGTTS